MNINKRILILLCMLLLVGCKRYVASNILGEDDVDVTYWVVDKKYRPIYCGEYICALSNPHPYKFNRADIIEIQKYLYNRIDNFDTTLLIDLNTKIVYKSSYIMYDEPVDLFNIELSNDSSDIHLEIRIAKDELLFPSLKDEERFRITGKK